MVKTYGVVSVTDKRHWCLGGYELEGLGPICSSNNVAWSGNEGKEIYQAAI